MLAKKAAKKKNMAHQVPRNRRESETVGQAQGHSAFKYKSVGSRFDILNTQGGSDEVNKVSDEEHIVSSINMGPKEDGPFVIFKDQPSVESCGTRHASASKARNVDGGKKSQLGPRIKEVKRMARANGSLKKALLVDSGPILSMRKENIDPNSKEKVQVIVPAVSNSEDDRARKPLIVSDASHGGVAGSGSQGKVLLRDPPSLDPKVDPCASKVDKNSQAKEKQGVMEVDGSQQLMMQTGVQYDAMLLERTNPQMF